MGMYRQRMPDREISAEMTKADYWEVQADMWHQNYKEAADEIERLREALRLAGDRVGRLAFKMPPPNAWTPQFVLLGQTIAREALKEKE